MHRHTERQTDIIIIISLSGVVGTNWKRLTKEMTWTNASLLVKKKKKKGGVGRSKTGWAITKIVVKLLQKPDTVNPTSITKWLNW